MSRARPTCPSFHFTSGSCHLHTVAPAGYPEARGRDRLTLRPGLEHGVAGMARGCAPSVRGCLLLCVSVSLSVFVTVPLSLCLCLSLSVSASLSVSLHLCLRTLALSPGSNLPRARCLHCEPVSSLGRQPSAGWAGRTDKAGGQRNRCDDGKLLLCLELCLSLPSCKLPALRKQGSSTLEGTLNAVFCDFCYPDLPSHKRRWAAAL